MNVHSLINSFVTVKPVLSSHTKRRPKIGFQDRLSLDAGQMYCRMLQKSILQYFRPSLNYRLSLRPLFCLFLSGCLKQVLLYLLSKKYELNLLHANFNIPASLDFRAGCNELNTYANLKGRFSRNKAPKMVAQLNLYICFCCLHAGFQVLILRGGPYTRL